MHAHKQQHHSSTPALLAQSHPSHSVILSHNICILSIATKNNQVTIKLSRTDKHTHNESQILSKKNLLT
ncbi:hypothetical protein GW750_07800 [bacterium]|nr:hypothetical protein [bacterium]